MSKRRNELSNYEPSIRPFVFHGVAFDGETDTQQIGTCPLCGKKRHFYVDKKTGQFDCKSCNTSGNIPTFLEALLDHHGNATTKRDLQRLKRMRSISIAALRSAEMSWNATRSVWMFPHRSATGTIQDMRIAAEPKLRPISTPGQKTGLWNLPDLVSARKRGWPVWICEGEWDGIALRTLFKTMGHNAVVVAVPGANTFKTEWITYFSNRDVVMAYDADDAGDDGMEKVGVGRSKPDGTFMPGAVSSVVKRLRYVRWPTTTPDGWDIRDAVHNGSVEDAFGTITALVDDRPRRNPESGGGGRRVRQSTRTSMDDSTPTASERGTGATTTSPGGSVEPRPTFHDVMETFRRYVKVDVDFENGVKLALGTIIAAQLTSGDPLWMYLVAPPGSGKTLITDAFLDNPYVVHRSSLTPHSLVSGFNANPDPSLMAILDGQTLVLKDFTEMLSMPVNMQDEIFSTLRGAYDGTVERSYGNAVTRRYDVRFTMLAGCTNQIHAVSRSNMGERCLKYQMVNIQQIDQDAVIQSAINNVGRESNMVGDICDAVNRFTDYDVDMDRVYTLVPGWARDRIVALSQIIGTLRATVSRADYTGEVTHRPTAEVGTRLAKQLVKVGCVIGEINGGRELTRTDYALVERVAFDTAIGWNLDVVQAMMDAGGGMAMTQKDIADAARLPSTNVRRRLDDMMELGIIHKRAAEHREGPRQAKFTFTLCEKLRALWDRAKVNDHRHKTRAVMARRRRRKDLP